MTTSSSVVAQLETTLAESAGNARKRNGIAADPPDGLGRSVPKHGRPAPLLWPCLLFAPGRPWWHRHGDHLKWLVRAVSAELECGPEGNRQTDAGPQVLCRGLVALLMAPHPS